MNGWMMQAETYFIVRSEEVESEDSDQLRQQCEDSWGGPRRRGTTYRDSGHGSNLECDGLRGEGPLVRVFKDDVRDVGHGREEKGGD